MREKIKTLLLNIPFNINDVSDYNGVLQPAGLSIISSYLKQHGCNVTLYDAFAHHTKKERIIQYIRHINPQILGVTLMTNHLTQTIPFLRDIKKMLPDIITVVGGAHPSSTYEDFLNHYKEVDIAVFGEGEQTMLEIIESVEDEKPLDQIKGISFRDNGNIKINPFRDYIQDLNALPFSDWESLPMENYWEIWTIKKNYANMILSRGCPFGCTFCGAKKALGKKQRKRSPEHILEEITLLYDRHHVRNILFSDSTLNIDVEWVKQICEGILRLERPILWGCNMRADRVDRQMLKLMKASGCVKVFIGVESADNRMLKRMKKGETIEKIEEGIRYIQEVGINPDLGFIFGMPGETEKSMQKSIAFVKKFKKSVCAFTLAAPFPGTQFYEEAKKEGLLVEDWAKYDIYKIAYIPKGLTKETLERYYKKAVKLTYVNPFFIIWQLFQIKSWINFTIKLRSAYRIFCKRLFELK